MRIRKRPNLSSPLSSSVPPGILGRYTVFVTSTSMTFGLRPARRALALVLLAAGAAGVFGVGLGGCGEALIDDNQPRSQYDRYDALRDQRPPASVEDEFGNRKPNLRGRLLRRD